MTSMRKVGFVSSVIAVPTNAASGAYHLATADYSMGTFQVACSAIMVGLAYHHRRQWMDTEQD